MRRVIIESPYSGATDFNVGYARRALADALARGEAPLASHLLYTQVLCDEVPVERKQGMDAGWAWIRMADAVVVYSDYGTTQGMRGAIEFAEAAGIPVEYRRIEGDQDE